MHLLEIMVIYDVGYADNLVVDNIETKWILSLSISTTLGVPVLFFFVHIYK
jgi:hypothetical protein